jgi:hypothetical protein
MPNVIIRQITTSDYNALAEFLSAFPGDERSSRQWLLRFRHWWDENPAYDENWVRGFVITDVDRIVGFVGSFPTFFQYEGHIIKAFNGTTWRVLEGFRNYSIDLWLKNREISNHVLSFNTTPTDNVIKLIGKLNYRLLPWGSKQESIYLLKISHYFKHVAGKKNRRYTIFLSPVIYIKQLWLNVRKISSFSFKIQESADSLFDELWERTKKQFENTNLRTADTVNWYSQSSTLVGIFKEEILTGYAILAESTTHVKELYLADLWIFYKSDNQELIRSIVGFAIELGRKKGCTIVRFPHFNDTLSTSFRKAGLLQKKTPRRNYYRMPLGMKSDFTKANSYFTLMQGDYGI